VILLNLFHPEILPFALRFEKTGDFLHTLLEIDCFVNKKRIKSLSDTATVINVPDIPEIYETGCATTRDTYLLFRMSITSPAIVSRLSFSICRRACARALLRNRNSFSSSLSLSCAAIRKKRIRRTAGDSEWKIHPFTGSRDPFGFLCGCIFALSAVSFLHRRARTVSFGSRNRDVAARFERQLADAFQYVPIIMRRHWY